MSTSSTSLTADRGEAWQSKTSSLGGGEKNEHLIRTRDLSINSVESLGADPHSASDCVRGRSRALLGRFATATASVCPCPCPSPLNSSTPRHKILPKGGKNFEACLNLPSILQDDVNSKNYPYFTSKITRQMSAQKSVKRGYFDHTFRCLSAISLSSQNRSLRPQFIIFGAIVGSPHHSTRKPSQSQIRKTI